MMKVAGVAALVLAMAGTAAGSDDVDKHEAGFFSCSVASENGAVLYVTDKSFAATRIDEGILIEQFGDAVTDAFPDTPSLGMPRCFFDPDQAAVDADLESVEGDYSYARLETIAFEPDL